MPDFSECRDAINTALLHLGRKYVCLRHLAAVPEEQRLEFASRIMFENAADLDTVHKTLRALGLFDDRSPNFCGTEDGDKLVERYILKDPAYRCSDHAEKTLSKGCVSRFCNCCTCRKNEARLEMERYLAQVYYHSPECFELDPKTVISKLRCCEVFSCIGDDRKCHYIEIPFYQAFFTAIYQLRKENRLLRISSFEDDSRKISEHITTQNKSFTNWKYLMRPTESYDEISLQITAFVLLFLKAPFSYDEQKFKEKASSLYSNTVYSDIPKHITDSFFSHNEPLPYAEDSALAMPESLLLVETIVPPVNQYNKEYDDVRNDENSEAPTAHKSVSVPYGIIENPDLNSETLPSSTEWQTSELMKLDEEVDVDCNRNEMPDESVEYNDYSGIILSGDSAQKENIINLSFSGFTHYCSLLRKSSLKLSLEPATVGGVFGLLMYCPVGEFRNRTVFADNRYLSRDFFLDVMLRNGTLVVTCNLCLFMSLARTFAICDIYNARSLGAAFCLLTDSDSIYPMRAVASAAGLSKDNPSVSELLQCYAAAWDSAGYDIFCKEGMKRKYMYTADYENALSTAYGFRKFMETTFDNMNRNSYLMQTFAYDSYQLGLFPRTGRLVALSCSPPLSNAGEAGERRYFYTVLLHYVLTHNEIRMRDWHLVSLGPDGITLHFETNDSFALETVLDALESAYTSTAKISSFHVPEFRVKRVIM